MHSHSPACPLSVTCTEVLARHASEVEALQRDTGRAVEAALAEARITADAAAKALRADLAAQQSTARRLQQQVRPAAPLACSQIRWQT